MVIPNPFMIPDGILDKIFTAVASSVPDMNGNSNGSTPNIKQDQPLAVLSNVSSDVASVFSPLLSIALCDIPLSTFSDDIKSAFGVFGVVTSVKLKPTGLWQYAVVHFKDTSSTAAALIHWSVLLSFTETKFYAKAAAYVVPPVAAAVDMDLGFGVSLIGIISLLPVVSFGSDVAVNVKLASLESHLGELSLLIKFLVESVGALVVLITKLLSALSVVDVSVKESVAGLAKQNKGFATITSII
ncbi:hypothetical protein G9A89_014106 [Geosiphon pyriformis]|nr:hypothetical protein G9A89_014106 [Geosiphon pyriformis]